MLSFLPNDIVSCPISISTVYIWPFQPTSSSIKGFCFCTFILHEVGLTSSPATGLPKLPCCLQYSSYTELYIQIYVCVCVCVRACVCVCKCVNVNLLINFYDHKMHCKMHTYKIFIMKHTHTHTYTHSLSLSHTHTHTHIHTNTQRCV